MSMQTSNSDESAPLSEINITPFVDVMLVLLVIFMVTAPLLETGIAVQLPKASKQALPKEQSPTILTITRDSKIFINREEVSSVELTRKLVTLFKSRPGQEIFIKADGALPYAVVAQLMAMVKNSGIQKIGLVTLPPEEKR